MHKGEWVMQKVLRQYRKFIAILLVLTVTFTSYNVWRFTGGKANATEVVTTVSQTAEETSEAKVIYASQNDMEDFRDESIYFVMTTRFYDGDSSNNVQCWDAQEKNANDPPWRGDFKGLIEKLDYIKALGFTAVWITPVVKNASGYDYHGYHALNFSEVDARYESEDCTYQDLINAVHERGMKIIQDVVLNHTGNFGEENLYPIFNKNEEKDLSTLECMELVTDQLPAGYDAMTPTAQYQARLALMKNTDGVNHDVNNLYHHWGMFNWESYEVQLGQMAGDCVDLNTENPIVYKYIQNAYNKYIEMGVDSFRVDTVKHISRLTFNKAFNEQFNDTYNNVHGTTGANNFFMFGEVCTRYRNVWNDNKPGISTPFFTWKESKNYPWNDNENDPNAHVENEIQCKKNYNDNTVENQPTSRNAFLNGNEYHTPDYSQKSGLDVIDFPMHWAFAKASDAFNTAKGGDQYYNDATFNVVYVDSHDYAPDTAPENQRFAQSQETWAENLSLMFSFRGIPCIYYGSEVEFQKGKVIDNGPNTPLAETGRAYFGDYLEGSVDVSDFATYTNATGEMANTLEHPLSLHIQRLNRLRAAVPALRKGQYSTEGCSGELSFKRRYTDNATDSFALVAISGSSTFSNIPNGTYKDAITGDVKVVTNGSFTATCNKKGDMRVYVLDTAKTPAPGMIMGHGSYLSGGGEVTNPTQVTSVSLDPKTASININSTLNLNATVQPSNATNKNLTWSTSNSAVATVSNGVVIGKAAGTATITATSSNGKTATSIITVTNEITQGTYMYFEKPSGWGSSINAYIWNDDQTYRNASWPGVPMTKKADGTYAIEYPSGKTNLNIIFNDGRNQTADLIAKKNGYYTVNGWNRDVAVEKVEVQSIALNKSSAKIDEGGKLTLTATILPSNATDQSVTWSSSNTTVATVSGGIVTGKKAGSTIITATSANGKSATATITVNEVVYESGYMYFEKPSGWGDTINAYMWTNDGTYKNAGWPGVKTTKRADGTYAIEYPSGKTNLNIIFNDGRSQTADLIAKNNGYYTVNGWHHEVDSEQVAVQSIALSKSSATIGEGSKVTLTATISPSNASDKTVIWKSSDTSVATVSAGVVTGKSAGTVTITATSANGKKDTATITVKASQQGYMYFTKPSGWGTTIYAYMWTNDGTYHNASWPGVKTTLKSDGTYAIEYPEGKNGLNIIFNDGKNQTADLSAKKNGYYTESGLTN